MLEKFLSLELLAALDEHVRNIVDDQLVAKAASRDGRNWYTLAEAAELLGCSYDAVRLRAKRGRLEVRRQGRTVLVSARSLKLR
jgi:excisionase family DNA binding protein